MAALLAFTLQPEERYLELTAPLHAQVDALELCPETTWSVDEQGELHPNGYQRRFERILERTAKRCLAHGVAFSPGSARPDARRRARWLARIAADHARMRFEWYSDHLGATELAGRNVALPVALPYTDAAAAKLRASLDALASVVPDVALENSAFYAMPGVALEEPAFLARCLDAPRRHLLLDLHNLFANGRNLGFEPEAWLERAPLERVIEVHLSGGRDAPAEWLPGRPPLRLDSHDDAVPEEVWRLAERWLPRCPNLRALTLERMEGTVEQGDVPLLRDELVRARRLLERRR